MILDIDKDYNEYIENYEYKTKDEYIKIREMLMNIYDIIDIHPLNIDYDIDYDIDLKIIS